MRCESAAELISAQLDGELSDVESDALAAHIRRCPYCRRRADELTALHRRLRLRAAEPVPDLSGRILASLPAGRTRTAVGRRLAMAAAAAVLVVAGTLGALALAAGRPGTSGGADLAVSSVVSPDPLGSSAVVYLTIRNEGADDRLVSASSPVASAVGLHVVTSHDGLSTMRTTETFVCSSRLALTPASSHLMLSGLHGDLDPGDRFPLTLHFEDSRPMVVDVEVVRWADLEDRVSLRT